MRNSILVRSIAAVSGIVMLASVAACCDNIASNTDSSASTDTKTTETVSGNFSGAGASSQQAAVEAWIAGFQGTNPDAKVAYNPSGSGAGVSTFLTGATAWAGSDAALADNEVEQSKSVCASGTAFDIPVYVSPIAVVFNLNGISGKGKTLNMDAETIAKIFDGKITKWNDDAIKKQNPKVDLPDLDITVVHRSDKSGTTKNFLSYVKDAAGDAWSYELGENWPNEVGQGAKGTSGVISTVISPPFAWITILISPSYMAMATLRTASGLMPSCFSFPFTSLLASPARVKSSAETWYCNTIAFSIRLHLRQVLLCRACRR